jgi:hypothetical protein
MLYCCNGAFKSGSTWLYIIVCNLVGRGEALPSRFENPKRLNRGLQRELLLPFLAEVDLTAAHYVIKSHYADAEAREALTANPNARVCGVSRDLKDVVVSAYFHYKRLGETAAPFEEFFWERGLRVAKRVHAYNELWSAPHPQIYMTRYEALHEDFAAEVGRLCEFLGLSPDPALIEAARANSSFKQQQAKEVQKKGESEHKFFRSGKARDWVNHLTPEMAAAVDAIQFGHGAPASS